MLSFSSLSTDIFGLTSIGWKSRRRLGLDWFFFWWEWKTDDDVRVRRETTNTNEQIRRVRNINIDLEEEEEEEISREKRFEELFQTRKNNFIRSTNTRESIRRNDLNDSILNEQRHRIVRIDFLFERNSFRTKKTTNLLQTNSLGFVIVSVIVVQRRRSSRDEWIHTRTNFDIDHLHFNYIGTKNDMNTIRVFVKENHTEHNNKHGSWTKREREREIVPLCQWIDGIDSTGVRTLTETIDFHLTSNAFLITVNIEMKSIVQQFIHRHRDQRNENLSIFHFIRLTLDWSIDGWIQVINSFESLLVTSSNTSPIEEKQSRWI